MSELDKGNYCIYPWYNPGRYVVDADNPGELQTVEAVADFADNTANANWEALKQPEVITDPGSGQQFHIAKLNWPEDGCPEDWSLICEPYSVTHQDYQRFDGVGPYSYELVEMAQQNPAMPMIAVDNPGANSDRLTRQQAQALRRSGSFTPIGVPLGRALKAADLRPTTVFGFSQGARVATGLLAAGRMPSVRRLGIVEGPGVTDFGFIDFTLGRFMGKEGAHKAEYLKRAEEENPQHIAIMREADRPARMVTGVGRWAVRGVAGNWLYTYPQAMARNTYPADIDLAMTRNTGLQVAYFAATAGEVAPIMDVNQCFTELRDKFSERIKLYKYPGATHSMSQGNPHYLAAGAFRQTLSR